MLLLLQATIYTFKIYFYWLHINMATPVVAVTMALVGVLLLVTDGYS